MTSNKKKEKKKKKFILSHTKKKIKEVIAPKVAAMGCGASTVRGDGERKDKKGGNATPVPPVIGPPVVQPEVHVIADKKKIEAEIGTNDYSMNKDAYDEFSEATIRANDKEVEEFQVGLYHGKPDEEIMMYFETCSPGLLYRIIKGTEWRFFNASRVYEMHVQFKFSASHDVESLQETELSKDEEGNTVAFTVVYPNVMTYFANAPEAMVTSKIKALPLSEPFLQKKAAEYFEITEPELAAIKVSKESSSEDVLNFCVQTNKKFVDREFLPIQDSIATGARKPMKTVPWARPEMYLQEALHEQIRLFRVTPHPAIVNQSVLGDSWVISGLSAICIHPKLIRSCFYHPRSPHLTKSENNVGAYRVTFSKGGWWTSVIVDSYLPVIGSLPKYSRSSTEVCEMWVSFLEKAYAKLHGSYANIVAGDPLMFIQDVTGFPTARYDEAFCDTRRGKALEFMHMLGNHLRREHIVIVHTPCRDRSRPGHDNDRHTFYTSSGLVMGHAYLVEKVVSISDDKKSSVLLKICNPWAGGVKWKGEWRDNSPKWTENPDAAEKCQHKTEDENSFWASWEEAQRYFCGCGIVFSTLRCYDYRIAGVFVNHVPTVVLQLTVKSPVFITFVLSVPDRRGTPRDEEDYPPILISLAEGSPDSTNSRITKNSHLDVEQPSKLFSFVQSRDVGMAVTLDPQHSPYMVIPRIIGDETISYTLGMISNEPFGTKSLECNFFQIPVNSKVFSNFPVFDRKECTKATAKYQVRPLNRSFPKEFSGSSISPHET